MSRTYRCADNKQTKRSHKKFAPYKRETYKYSQEEY